MRRARTDLPLSEALALGIVQGPAELLPVSSSGHLVLLPELLGWHYARLDPALRKAFEVALHAGTAAALLIALRREVQEVVRDLDARRVVRVALAFLPPAGAGLLLEDLIERRAGAPERVAAMQVVAGLALFAADRRPADRAYGDANELDHLLLGVAQAAALVPGVSRNGATLTAARLRRLDRPAAGRLSRHAALPIIVGASVLKGVRLRQRGVPREILVAFGVGALAALASTAACGSLLALVDRVRSYGPLSAYRVLVGAVALAGLRRAPEAS